MDREQIGEVYDAGREAVIALVEGLLARTAALEAQVAELQARLDKNSRNSSKPPSSDGYSKPPPRKRSLRRSSGRKPGGQEGHPGSYLAQVDEPDQVIVHVPTACGGCGRGLADAPVTGAERRQVFDLPPPAGLLVAEHRAERRACECGHETVAAFPTDVRAPAQYGCWVRAYAIYLVGYQHLPYDRAAALLGDLFGAPLSTGTLAGIVARGTAGLEPFIAAVRAQLRGADVGHFDETGARIEGALHWVTSASTKGLTLYGLDRSRGEGVEDLGVLDGFEGVAVHDGWTFYNRYGSAEHALCGGHILRELQAITDGDPEGQSWAAEMAKLLRFALAATDEARAAGRKRLAAAKLAAIEARYDEVIAAGQRQNPEPERTGRRGRPKRPPSLNLLRRLDSERDRVLRFARDLRVPFDNNQAERDLRMVKLQQKISGCWRTLAGARTFLDYRSYLSTGRKQGESPLVLLLALAKGEAWVPSAAEP